MSKLRNLWSDDLASGDKRPLAVAFLLLLRQPVVMRFLTVKIRGFGGQWR
jgi:hypothetical protein